MKYVRLNLLGMQMIVSVLPPGPHVSYVANRQVEMTTVEHPSRTLPIPKLGSFATIEERRDAKAELRAGSDVMTLLSGVQDSRGKEFKGVGVEATLISWTITVLLVWLKSTDGQDFEEMREEHRKHLLGQFRRLNITHIEDGTEEEYFSLPNVTILTRGQCF